jgi:hypothetical protein
VSAGPWLGTVTRVDPAGRPYVRVRRLTGEAGEYGPLSSVRDRVRVVVPVAGGGTSTVEGAVVYVAGDQVLVSDVAGQPSVFVVVGRVG